MGRSSVANSTMNYQEGHVLVASEKARMWCQSSMASSFGICAFNHLRLKNIEERPLVRIRRIPLVVIGRLGLGSRMTTRSGAAGMETVRLIALPQHSSRGSMEIYVHRGVKTSKRKQCFAQRSELDRASLFRNHVTCLRAKSFE